MTVPLRHSIKAEMMMHDFKLIPLRGAGQGRYLSVNKGRSLFGYINKYTGVRCQIEKLCLLVSEFLYAPFVNQENLTVPISQGLSVLSNQFGRLDKGFLMDTSWYKDSYCVGSVYFPNTSIFFKYFKVMGLAQHEASCQKTIADLYKASFLFAEVKYVDDQLIAFALIPNNGAQCSQHFMRKAAIQMYGKSKPNNNTDFATLTAEVVNLLQGVALPEDLNVTLLFILKALSDDKTALSLLFCHGDYTTWNTVIDIDNPELCYLIDSERCAERVLYTDLFHLFTQKACLEAASLDSVVILNELAVALGDESAVIFNCYMGYLLEELSINLREWDSGKNHAQLFNLIVGQFQLLVECYSYSKGKT